MTTSALHISRAVLLGLILIAPATLIADSSTATITQNTLSATQAFDKGKQFIRNNQLAQGLSWLDKAASLGHANAAFELGSLYEAGLGVPKDYGRAKSYYERAIAKGHRNAHFNLALLLNNGQVPFSDLQKSRELMQVVAQQGDVEAQYTLATLLQSSLRNIDAQPEQSIPWLQRAADKGHSKAQFMLGMHYLKGENIGRNPMIAFNLFNKAAQQGVSGAQFNLALMYEKGDGIAANNAQALRWYESAANLGNANAQQNLGIKYLVGEELAANTPKALNLLNQAANAGLRNSQFLLGQLYQSGYEGKVVINLAQAERWYLRAAQQGQPDAQYQLALILLEKQNGANSAQFWIEQAVAAGHEGAIKLKAKL